MSHELLFMLFHSHRMFLSTRFLLNHERRQFSEKTCLKTCFSVIEQGSSSVYNDKYQIRECQDFVHTSLCIKVCIFLSNWNKVFSCNNYYSFLWNVLLISFLDDILFNEIQNNLLFCNLIVQRTQPLGWYTACRRMSSYVIY